MEFKNNILHIINDKYDTSFTLRFSYDYDKDEVKVEDLGIHNNWNVLEGNSLNKIIRYAMLDQKYNNYVYGIKISEEIFYNIEEFYKSTHQKRREDVEIEDSPAISQFRNKIRSLKAKLK